WTAFMNRIIAPARNAAIDPTERSMPPAMITNVAPTAMIPMNAERVRTLKMFVGVRNDGWMSEPTTTSRTRPSSGVSCCHGTRPSLSRQVGAGATSETDMGLRCPRVGDAAVAAQAGRVGDHRLLGQLVARHDPRPHASLITAEPLGPA